MAAPNLAEDLATRLRRDILRGKLPPGTSIKERDNAAEMGVSRTPMREAIRILAKEGLVELRPSRSPIVAAPAVKEVADQAEVLIALETLSAELACAHASHADLENISALATELAVRFDDIDPLDVFEIDMSFHSAIAEASKNAALADIHRTLLRRLWRARYLAAMQRRNRERVVQQHARIAEALQSRDPDAARSAIAHHLYRLADDIRDVMASETPDGAAAE